MSEKIINDFSITVGTVNGSGSQTSNLTILRALFKMGIPVSGKNLFPSNIQGLPTWYTIRVSKDGYTARRAEHEIVIAMNANSFEKDLAEVLPGGIFLYNQSIRKPIERDDIIVYPMDVNGILRAQEVPSNLKTMVANMVYVGVLAQLIGIDMDKIHQALDFHFKGKEKPIEINMGVIRAAAEWAAENLEKKDPYYVEEMDETKDLIMTDGNTAAALGSIYGGVQFVGWYPITPATSLVETMNKYLPKLRNTEDGKQTYLVVQAEDELAAIGMAIGAGWAGLRAMTSTSGPGISLMAEYLGLAYYAEIPVVIWNVQRVGPSTGLPTRTAQGDLTLTYFLSHGDTQHVILLPGSVTEIFEFGWKAFDIAERLQTPVFVISDLDFGQNQWMTEPFQYPDTKMDRGKILWEEDLEKIKDEWGRYLDMDGDGIPYRTVPGNRHPKSAYFTRGTGHDEFARYSEDPDTWRRLMARLAKKFQTAKQYMPSPVIETMDDAKVGIIAFGSTDPAIKEARDMLAAEKGIQTDYLRLRAIPCREEVDNFIHSHDRVYIVEMNRDGQLHQMLKIHCQPEYIGKLRSIAMIDGMPLTAKWVKEAILAQEVK